MDDWERTIREKIAGLELIASWASTTNFGTVRDLCRKAQYELHQYLRRQADDAEYLDEMKRRNEQCQNR